MLVKAAVLVRFWYSVDDLPVGVTALTGEKQGHFDEKSAFLVFYPEQCKKHIFSMLRGSIEKNDEIF